jgi:hypothetical protein
MPTPLDQIPGLKRAIARAEQRDADRRDMAFLDEAPRSLCGVSVLPLNLRHLLCLFLARSPFVCGGAVRVEHVVQFIDIVSPDFELGNLKRHKARRKKFIDGLIFRAKFAAAVKAIDAFLDDAWRDRPASKGKSGSAIASFAAAMVHEFAWAYGWLSDYTMRRPLAQLYQLLRFIAREHNPKAPLFAGSADKVKGEYLRRRAAAQKKAAGKGKK